MKLETAKGKVYEIGMIAKGIREEKQVMIRITEGKPVHEIAADFDGLESFKTYENPEDDYHVYRGYTRLTSMQQNFQDGSVRLTLSKP